jgi:hypothetical protein
MTGVDDDDDDDDASLIVFYAKMILHAPTRTLSNPAPPAKALTWAGGIIGKIEKGRTYAVADDPVECGVLLASPRRQLDLVRAHPRSAFGKLSVNVGQAIGAPVIGIPLGECFPCGGDGGGHDRGNPSALGVDEVDHLPPLGSVVRCAS